MATSKKRRIRYAVVGQGYFAQMAVLPAFAHAKNAELAALVSNDPEKLEKLGKDYGVETLVPYDKLDELLDSGRIDALYVAVPNAEHREITERAARAGVHVLCEKPLGVTVADCEAMIEACDRAGVKLMTAYRLHFEKTNLTAIEHVKGGQLGEPRLFTSTFTMNVKEGNTRLKAADGGGPLWDIGIYCLNAARNLFRAEPIQVFCLGGSRAGDPRWSEVHEQVSAIMRFPEDRLASFTVSFGAADLSAYDVVGTEASLHVEPAFDFAHDLALTLRAGEGPPRKRTFKKRDQVAPEISYFADCILHNREPEPSGREGLADVRVIEALYHSMKEGRPVDLEPFTKTARPDMTMEDHEPLGKEPELFHAEQPSG